MLINYDKTKISNIMQDFYNTTGININFYTTNFSYISNRSLYNNECCKIIQKNEAGIYKCNFSDENLIKRCIESRKAEVITCHAGFVDICVPVFLGETIVGYLVLGQIKTEDNLEEIKKTFDFETDEDLKIFEKNYLAMPIYTEDRIDSLINIASMVAKQILFEDGLLPVRNSNLDNAIKYIDKTFDKNMSVSEIAKSVNMSVSTLYKIFETNMNCTPKEYINKKRVEKSIELLKNTDFSIELVAHKVGFSCTSYYTEIFKKIKGTTPSKVRKQNNKKK